MPRKIRAMMTRITMTTRNQGRQRHQPETNSPRSPFSLLVQRTKSSLPRMHVQSISLDSRQSTNITRQSTAFPLLGLSYKVAPHPATKPTASRSSQWLKPETVSARSGAVHLWTKRRYTNASLKTRHYDRGVILRQRAKSFPCPWKPAWDQEAGGRAGCGRRCRNRGHRLSCGANNWTASRARNEHNAKICGNR